MHERHNDFADGSNIFAEWGVVADNWFSWDKPLLPKHNKKTVGQKLNYI